MWRCSRNEKCPYCFAVCWKLLFSICALQRSFFYERDFRIYYKPKSVFQIWWYFVIFVAVLWDAFFSGSSPFQPKLAIFHFSNIFILSTTFVATLIKTKHCKMLQSCHRKKFQRLCHCWKEIVPFMSDLFALKGFQYVKNEKFPL